MSTVHVIKNQNIFLTKKGRTRMLSEFKKTAFAKWLLQQDRNTACVHLFDCLLQGESENQAWVLFELVHGSRTFSPAELTLAINQMIDALEEESKAVS